MMKKYAVAAAIAGSLLAAPAFAQDATSCSTMLSDFDAHLAANNIQATDERVTSARTEAEQACMSGDMTAAEASLDKAVADLGIPPRQGATGADVGATQNQESSTTGTTGSTTGTDTSGSTTGTDTSGSASGSSTTTGSGSTTGSGTDTQSGGTTSGGTTSTQ
jgi:hypothetical protein